MCRGPGYAGTVSTPCLRVVDELVVEVVFTGRQDNVPVATVLERLDPHHHQVMTW